MLARLGDNDKCQEPWVPFLATLKFIQMVQSSSLLCWGKKKKKKGGREWGMTGPLKREQVPVNWQTNRELEEETYYQRDRQNGLLWPLCFIPSRNCADAHVVQGTIVYGRENGKHVITVTWNPSCPMWITDPWRRLQIKYSTVATVALQSSSPV